MAQMTPQICRKHRKLGVVKPEIAEALNQKY